MGTVKRERQKANRQLRLEEIAKQARRDKTKRTGLRLGIVLAAVVADVAFPVGVTSPKWWLTHRRFEANRHHSTKLPRNRRVRVAQRDAERVLPIWVGVVEANAIALQIEKVAPPRPMTHDLLANTIAALGGRVLRILERPADADIQREKNWLLEPPGQRERSYGFRVCPPIELMLVTPDASSWRFVLPRMMAPAARSWAATDRKSVV